MKFNLQPTTSNLQPTGGFALLYAILTASVLLLITFAISNISFKELVLSSQVKDSQTAIFAADSALECALYWDLQHPGIPQSPFGGFSALTTLGNGLVGYWALDVVTLPGPTTPDGVYDRDGVLRNTNGVLVTGKIGNALRFRGGPGDSGSSEYVEIPEDLKIAMEAGSGSITAWVRILAPNDGKKRVIFEIGEVVPGIPPTKPNYISLRKGDNTEDNKLIARYVSGGVVKDKLSLGKAESGWHHIAMTWGPNTLGQNKLSLYVDGAPQGTATDFTPFGDADDLTDARIGVDAGNDDGTYFKGDIDEVRVYRRPLSAVEVKALAGQAGGGFIPPLEPGDAEELHDTPLDCAEQDINEDGNWVVGGGGVGGGSTVTFSIDFPGTDRCANVFVSKDQNGSSRIESRGYNTCDIDNPRRVERALRATY